MRTKTGKHVCRPDVCQQTNRRSDDDKAPLLIYGNGNSRHVSWVLAASKLTQQKCFHLPIWHLLKKKRNDLFSKFDDLFFLLNFDVSVTNLRCETHKSSQMFENRRTEDVPLQNSDCKWHNRCVDIWEGQGHVTWNQISVWKPMLFSSLLSTLCRNLPTPWSHFTQTNFVPS